MTFISRILGFVRDMLVASVFGAGGAYDAFIIAFKIPNFMRRLFAEGAFSQAFIPIFSEYKTKGSKAALKQFLDQVASNLSLVVAVITIIGILAAPLVIQVFAPGFINEPERFDLAVRLLRITFAYLFFISLAALAGGVLNSYGRFAVPAFSPVLLNLSMIAATCLLAPKMDVPIEALAWGVLIGGALQLLVQIPDLIKLGLMPRLRVSWSDPGVKRVLTLMLPALFAASVIQINLMIASIFASFLPQGSLSWLYYSDRLLEFPLGVFGVALSTVVLPQLSKQYAAKAEGAFVATLDWSLRWIVLIGLPASVGLWVLSDEIVCTLFQYGQFSLEDTQKTGLSVAMFSMGIISFIGAKVLTSAYYARQNMRFPLKVAIISLCTNSVASFCLMGPFAHAGLALASVLSASLSFAFLVIKLYRDGFYKPLLGWGFFLARTGIAALFMFGLLVYLKPELEFWSAWSPALRFTWLFGLVLAALLAYCLTLLVLGLKTKDFLSPKLSS
jgi:putative peptidoglycan lipid II flippase